MAACCCIAAETCLKSGSRSSFYDHRCFYGDAIKIKLIMASAKQKNHWIIIALME